MDSVKCEYIQKLVVDRLAHSRKGKMSLSEIQRIFSDYQSSEVQKCMDALTRTRPPMAIRVAKKEGGREMLYYIFPTVAKEFEERLSSQLKKSRADQTEIEKELRDIRDSVKAMERVSETWQLGWERLDLDPELLVSLKQFIAARWGSEISRTRRVLAERETKGKDIALGINLLQTELEETFEAI